MSLFQLMVMSLLGLIFFPTAYSKGLHRLRFNIKSEAHSGDKHDIQGTCEASGALNWEDCTIAVKGLSTNGLIKYGLSQGKYNTIRTCKVGITSNTKGPQNDTSLKITLPKAEEGLKKLKKVCSTKPGKVVISEFAILSAGLADWRRSCCLWIAFPDTHCFFRFVRSLPSVRILNKIIGDKRIWILLATH